MSMLSESQEAEVRSISERAETDRQERWAQEREDKASLRQALEAPVARLTDSPRAKKSLDDTPDDPMKPFDGIRQTAERAYQEAHVNAAKEDRRQRDIAAFETIGRQIKRAHGIEPIEGIRALLGAERALRENPEAALRKLAADYWQNDALAAQTAQREADGTLAEVNSFFDGHDIPDPVVDLMLHYVSTPEFQRTRTGDHEADLQRAYRAVKRGLDRVHVR